MKQKIHIYKVLKTTAGGLHSWVESSVGRIRKPNNIIPQLQRSEELPKPKIVNITCQKQDDIKKDMIYSYKKTLIKGLKYAVVYGGSFLVTGFISTQPEVAGITLGTLLLMLMNWLKCKLGIRLP